MTTLADQLMNLLAKRMPTAIMKGEVAMANMISDQMEENTENGRAFGDDPYDNVYAPVTVRDRTRLGLSSGNVTLRRTKHRIETTIVSHTKANGASIRFGQGGKIFKEHHIGQSVSAKKTYAMPIRSIFPKSMRSVPEDIVIDTKMIVAEVLLGNN
jgi:hypothetical protein